jgi:hypothetical protein
MTLFILWGLALISGEFPHEWGIPVWIQNVFFMGLFFVLPIGLCIGWIKSFPRWSYPYVGHVLIFSLYMMNVATPGFLFGRELWGWRAWVPFLVIAGIALAATRSLEPVARFYKNILEDWTVLTFGLFGFMPLVIAITFDEIDRLYSLYFMVALTLLMCGTTFLYLHGKDQRQRTVVLTAGVVLTILIAILGPAFYWKGTDWVRQVQTILAGILIMFSPALIEILPRFLSRKAV